MTPGRCTSCRRDVLQVWLVDGTAEALCCRCIGELLEWPPLLTTDELMRRLRLENP